MSLRVLEPGLQTLVVDFGRPHCRSLGLPVGGAADRTSLALGNALVGNSPDAAALEFTLSGPTLEAQTELACVVYGAPFELHSDRQKLRLGKTFTLQPGEVLEIRGTPSEMRAYLCVTGGLQEKIILGSRSSLAPIQKDAVLTCPPGRIVQRFAKVDWEWNLNYSPRIGLKVFGSSPLTPNPSPSRGEGSKISPLAPWGRGVGGEGSACRVPHSESEPTLLRFLDGPQATWFPDDGLTGRDVQPPDCFVATPASNRMGIRLKRWEPLAVPDRELVSEPVCPGTVQVTRDGQCIILGVDGQTIGGYPKIGQVISADLDALGQLRPGAQVYFQRVTLEEAERLYQAKQQELHRWITRMHVSLGAFTDSSFAARRHPLQFSRFLTTLHNVCSQ